MSPPRNSLSTTINIPSTPAKRWDIFCRVIDNFGDAGVCWRLAQQLSIEHHQQVHLWIDDLGALATLIPAIQTDQAQQIADQVLVHHWQANMHEPCSADVVIEAFACELPTTYLASMAKLKKPPCWINLEYLSAENWVEGCHGLASPHPTLRLKKHFFFPGFTEQTGGLLWGRPPIVAPEFLSSLGLTPKFDGLTISFFAYDHIPAHALMMAWQNSTQPIRCLIPPGKPRHLIESALTCPLDQIIQRGQLSLIPMPFLSQSNYDQLLLACDLNFVRGEDSFIRAQWAGKPLIWQIYPQEDSAHMDKLHAFLTRYSQDLPHTAKKALLETHQHWNQAPSASDSLAICSAWERFTTEQLTLSGHATKWAQKHHQKLGLAENLVKFSRLSV